MNPFDLAQEAVDIDRSLEEVSPVYAELAGIARDARATKSYSDPLAPERQDDYESTESRELRTKAAGYLKKAEGIIDDPASDIPDYVRLADYASVATMSLDEGLMDRAYARVYAEHPVIDSYNGESLIVHLSEARAKIGDVGLALSMISLIPLNEQVSNAYVEIAKHGQAGEALDLLDARIGNLEKEMQDKIGPQRVELLCLAGHTDQALSYIENIGDEPARLMAMLEYVELTRDRDILMKAMRFWESLGSDQSYSFELQRAISASGNLDLLKDVLKGRDQSVCRHILQGAYEVSGDAEIKSQIINLFDSSQDIFIDPQKAAFCQSLVRWDETDEARDLAESIIDVDSRMRARIAIASKDQSIDILSEALASIAQQAETTKVITLLTQVLQVRPTLEDSEDVFFALPNNYADHRYYYCNLIEAMIAAGNMCRAEEIAQAVTYDVGRAQAYAVLARELGRQADTLDAEQEAGGAE